MTCKLTLATLVSAGKKVLNYDSSFVWRVVASKYEMYGLANRGSLRISGTSIAKLRKTLNRQRLNDNERRSPNNYVEGGKVLIKN